MRQPCATLPSKKCSVPGAAEPQAVSADEARQLFAALEFADAALLAVSGGSDSMALMWLAARWARGTSWPGKLHVAVVDHGLRPEAADEACFVEEQAQQLNLPVRMLKWDGPYPKTGISAAAREARYALMAEVCRAHEAVLVTAHTQDDQAETMLMALARGAGVNGLSAMQPVSIMNGVTLLRPLLGFARERLRATLRMAGVSWIDDPTNEEEKYERVRVRKGLAVLAGLGVSGRDFACSSARLLRAREALDHGARALMRDCVVHEPSGFVRIALKPFVDAFEETQLRMVLAVIKTYGGGMEQGLSGAEALLNWMVAGTTRARTFAGCRIVRRREEFVVGRELARVSRAPHTLKPGRTVTRWDSRYEVIASDKAKAAMLMRLADVGENLLPKRPADVPDFVWQGLPVVADAAGNIFVPGYRSQKVAEFEQNYVFHLVHGVSLPKS